jgi:23S rRNA G2069 N7-methylase RlmK/C1962 C5-methylase RlmI
MAQTKMILRRLFDFLPASEVHKDATRMMKYKPEGQKLYKYQQQQAEMTIVEEQTLLFEAGCSC